MFDNIEYHEDYGWVCFCDEADEWFFGCCFMYAGKVLILSLVPTSLGFNHVRQYHLVWLGVGLLLR